MTELESPGGRTAPVSAFWRGHADQVLITGIVVLQAATLGFSALSGLWGTGSARVLTAAAVGLAALALMLALAVAAAAEWRRQRRTRRSLPPTPALTGRLTLKALGSMRILLPATLIMAGNFSLGLAGAVNAVAWLSDRHAWLPRGYPTVRTPAGAWGSLAAGAFLLAILVFFVARLIITVRADVRLVTRVPASPEPEPVKPLMPAAVGQAATRPDEPGLSLADGPDGVARPAALGHVRAAQCTAITDPRLTLWAELTVVGHLTGWGMPRPSPGFTASLRAMDARQRDCAISHATDAAVASRTPAISARVSPAALAAHVVAAMRQVVSEGRPDCATKEEPQYLAPPYRWALVRDVLRSAAPGGEGRHPRSQEWERAYGQPVPGETVSEQARVVTRWYASDQGDACAVATVIWGTRSPSAIERAVGCRADDPGWPALLDEMLAAFARSPWPGVLRRRYPPARKQAAAE